MHANERRDALELGSSGPIALQIKELIEGQKSLQKELHQMRTQVGADSQELEILRQQNYESPVESPQWHMDCRHHEQFISPLAVQQQQQQQRQQQHGHFQHHQQHENSE